MKGKILLLGVGILIVTFLLFMNPKIQNILTPSSAYPVNSPFSRGADKSFISYIGSDIDLNSGITLERATSLYSDQINDIDFAVFNHTDEPVVFPNQGFGVTVFRYDEVNKLWESLQLQHMPYPEEKTLPPKLEKWDFDINNSWDILEGDITGVGYIPIRLYVSGRGKITNKIYGAYLDATILMSR